MQTNNDTTKETNASNLASRGWMMRLVRLLPCPFCGTESGTPTGPMYLKNGDMWEGMMHDIHCISCTVTMSDYSREKVEAKWNLRCLPNGKHMHHWKRVGKAHTGLRFKLG